MTATVSIVHSTSLLYNALTLHSFFLDTYIIFFVVDNGECETDLVFKCKIFSSGVESVWQGRGTHHKVGAKRNKKDNHFLQPLSATIFCNHFLFRTAYLLYLNITVQ